MVSPRLQLVHINKTFPGVKAVRDVSLDAYAGEVLALVGENGAGKSTLMNILTGGVQADSGSILLDGQEVVVESPRQAIQLGVTIIHQELALIPQLTVGQNIYLGREPRRKGGLFIDWETLYAQAKKEMDRIGIDIPVDEKIIDLSIAQQQLIEIAKALSYDARVIVLDEPTSALTERETETLFRLVKSLKEKGVALIYISHRMAEVFELADRIAVMRDGQLVGVKGAGEISPDQIVKMMVGRDLGEFYPRQHAEIGPVVLEGKGLSRGRSLQGIDFQLHSGEILGVAGLVGAGRTDLARALFGADRLESGEIWLNGKRVEIKSPADAIRQGIGFLPEDRKRQGIFAGQTVRSNTVAGSLGDYTFIGVLDFRKIRAMVSEMIRKLNLRTTGQSQKVRNLSGGNQQKVVLARWLAINPKVLILDEPTRGVDVGAKVEIYNLIGELAKQGVGILMISSELPEVLGVSDRILVMREGKKMAEFDRSQATQDRIMSAATGELIQANPSLTAGG